MGVGGFWAELLRGRKILRFVCHLEGPRTLAHYRGLTITNTILGFLIVIITV